MYLFIFEDGSMYRRDSYSEDELQDVGNGILNIVCFDESHDGFRQLDETGDFKPGILLK